jgi:hypothetical protein
MKIPRDVDHIVIPAAGRAEFLIQCNITAGMGSQSSPLFPFVALLVGLTLPPAIHIYTSDSLLPKYCKLLVHIYRFTSLDSVTCWSEIGPRFPCFYSDSLHAHVT